MPMSGLVLLLSGWMAVVSAPPADTTLLTDPVGQWIPADTAVVVEVTNAGKWSEGFSDNQLGQILIRFSPANRFVRGWRRMQRMLEQSSGQMVDKYFGKSVVLLAAYTSPGSPMVIVSRLTDRQTALDLITKLELEEREVYADHHVYQTPDGGAILSLHDNSPTIIFTSERNTAYLKRLIDAAKTEPLLKDDKAFGQFMAATPADAVVKGYIRPLDDTEKHSFYVTYDATGIRGQYIGKMPQIADVLSQLGSANMPHSFGPLPPDCMAAVSINLGNSHPQTVEFINRIIAPKSFVDDVQPKLGKSMVVFLTKPQQLQMIPALGIAIQMKDTDLTADMDTFMKNLMVVSSLSLEKRHKPATPDQAEKPEADQPIQPVQPTLVVHNKTAYRTAPVANIKMIQQGLTVVTPIQMSWGRINDWYVISSDKETFCQCVDNPTDKPALIQPVNHAQPIATPGTPIAELQIKPQVLVDHLERFAHDEPAAVDPGDRPMPPGGTDGQYYGRRRYRQPPIRISDFCDGLSQFSQMRISIYRDDQNQMVTQVELTKKPAE